MVPDLSGSVPGPMGVCTLGTISVFSPISGSKVSKIKPCARRVSLYLVSGEVIPYYLTLS